jgi:hypothetical protein
MRAHTKRIGRIRDAIDAAPVRRGILNEAYEWFTMFGELTDDDHVAFEVVEKALRGGEDAPLEAEGRIAKRVAKARLAYHRREHPRDTWPPSVRAMLFDEALFDPEPLRGIARAAIATEVAWGGDVENPAFAARHGIPGYGSVAMHVCGYPRQLAIPPYEDQAERLFVRLDNLRGRIDQDNPDWEAQGRALAAFWQAGELPGDDLLLEGVLVNVELDLLHAHKRGKKVGKAMELLARLRRAEGDEYEDLLVKLSGMAAAKRLL